MSSSMGVQTVVIIHNEGTQDEERIDAQASIRANKGTFEVETPIYEGDIVEMDDPRGGRDRRVAVDVKVHTIHPQRTTVTWGKSAPVRTAPVRRLVLENLHAQVISCSSDLFNDGQFSAAVSEAFKSPRKAVTVEELGADWLASQPMLHKQLDEIRRVLRAADKDRNGHL